MVSPWRHKYSLGEARLSIGLQKKLMTGQRTNCTRWNRLIEWSPKAAQSHRGTHNAALDSFSWPGKEKKSKHSWGMCEMCSVGGEVWHMWLFARHEKLPGLSRCASPFPPFAVVAVKLICVLRCEGNCICLYCVGFPEFRLWLMQIQSWCTWFPHHTLHSTPWFCSPEPNIEPIRSKFSNFFGLLTSLCKHHYNTEMRCVQNCP